MISRSLANIKPESIDFTHTFIHVTLELEGKHTLALFCGSEAKQTSFNLSILPFLSNYDMWFILLNNNTTDL